MKKFLSLLCMITCVFGLTACGSGADLTQRERQNVDSAKKMAVEEVLPTLELFMNDDDLKLGEYTPEEYTAEEVAHLVSENYGFEVADGYKFLNAVTSFRSAKKSIGSITGKPDVQSADVTAKIDDSQIIVTVQVKGAEKDAEAEIIFSNDMFLTLESAALNPISSFKEMMTKAALNTLIGMGTVFLVLVLICLLISCFAVIPKIQAAFSKKSETPASSADKVVAQITQKEEVVEESDDLELVAVIAAAIAASEGAVSTDGFVVRSIRRRG
ncbi:MAG: OadG family protein [Bacteroidales bacterium]|nr:OadG family protein [Lachnoclostridium sp.]MCM1383560.1 OadG family protein [Lachnoclostridium sp.]MCM1464157.1 OadG family protein [Bacteroidales bacterium]